MTAYIKGKSVVHVTLTGLPEDVLCPWGRRTVAGASGYSFVDPTPDLPWCTRCQALLRAAVASALPEVARYLATNGKVRKAPAGVK